MKAKVDVRMARFFINRPIVAIVISLVTVIAGAISVTFLPVSLFPEIVTPRDRCYRQLYRGRCANR